MKENFSRQENELNKSLTNLVVKWGKLINNSRLNPMFQIIYKKHVVGKKNFQILKKLKLMVKQIGIMTPSSHATL